VKNDSVIIVGAGPVGVLNALGLARRGIKVTLLEREESVVESPRAMVYHWSVLKGLNELGVLDDALEVGFKKQDYSYLVWSTKEFIYWDLKPLEGLEEFPHNLHLGQNELAKIALKHLAQYPDVEVHWGTKVTGVSQDGDSVTVHATGPQGEVDYTAGWAIAADGAGSVMRESVGLGFEGMTWPERFVATNIRYDFESYGYRQSVMQIDPVYGAIIAKIDRSNLWRVTYMEDESLPIEGVLDRMPAYFKEILPGDKDYQLEQFSPYRMHQRSAESYRVGRVLLAGDAAHATNPTGGLGLTSGLFDTYVLYPALAAVIRGEADDSVLDDYSEKRRKVFLEVASPQASENKRFVYGSNDPVRLEQDLDQVRKGLADRELLMKRLTFPSKLQTPPLVPSGAGAV